MQVHVMIYDNGKIISVILFYKLFCFSLNRIQTF